MISFCHTRTQTHTYTHIHSHSLTHIHIHIHIHTCSLISSFSLCDLYVSLAPLQNIILGRVIKLSLLPSIFFSRDLERTRRLSVQLPLLFPECQRNEIPRREAGVELFCHKSREKSPVYPIDYSMGGPRFCYHPVPVLRENFVTPAEFSRRMPLREVGGLIEGPRLMHLSASCGETEAG